MFNIIYLSIHYSHVRLDYDSIYTIQISSTFFLFGIVHLD